MSLRKTPLLGIAFVLIAALMPSFLMAQKPIQKESSWEPASRESIVANFETWLLDAKVDETSAKLVRELSLIHISEPTRPL